MGSRVIVAAIGGLLWCSAASADPTAKFTGSVMSAGKPVVGATVMVNRAYPIQGLAYYCPGCYLDCGKKATTDDKGNWSITGLSDELKFELIIVAKGHVPEFTPVINPAEAGPLKVELDARDLAALRPDQIVRGRVLTPSGRPIQHAVVSPSMVWASDGGCGGLCDGLDQLAVTDEEGRFALVYTKGCDSMDLAVSARAMARSCFPRKASGGKEHDLSIIEGASISGRLIRDGKPLKDVQMTLVSGRTFGEACFERQEIATNDDGQFLFVNVLPGQAYTLAATTSQLESGCVIPKQITVAKDGEEIDAGDLPITRGVRLAGRITPPDHGKSLAGAKLMLSSDDAWDSVALDLDETGVFAFPEVPPGGYTLMLTSPGVYVTHRNLSADKLNNMNSLVGRIERDILDLEIETSTIRPKPPNRGNTGDWPELGGIEGKRK